MSPHPPASDGRLPGFEADEDPDDRSGGVTRRTRSSHTFAQPPVGDEPSPLWLEEQIRTNVRLIKAVRAMTDEAIAEAGGYTSRKVFASRTLGQVPVDAEDLARMAAALGVEPQVLLMRSEDALRWVADNPTYEPPHYAKQEARLARREDEAPPD
jgi:hypothetical protein